MKRNILIGLVALIATVIMSSCVGYERIDAGYDGIIVNKYGDEKGVDAVTEVTGAVWFNTIKKDVYEVPIFMQDYNYESMVFKTADLLDVTLDVGVQVSLPTGKTPALFIKYRNYFSKGGVDLNELIYKHTRQAFSDAVGMYDAEELITKKEEFGNLANEKVKMTLGSIIKEDNGDEWGFLVDDVFLLGDPGLPTAIMDQVEAKINADQIAQKKESELRQTEADAKKVVAKAEGDKLAMILRAEGEAQAYVLQTRALTPAILEKMFIDKWDGTYGTGNVFGAGTMPVKQIK